MSEYRVLERKYKILLNTKSNQLPECAELYGIMSSLNLADSKGILYSWMLDQIFVSDKTGMISQNTLTKYREPDDTFLGLVIHRKQ